MVHLRELKNTDAPFMLEWMRDKDITEYLEEDFGGISIEDCEKYIFASAYKISRRDFAVADENDEYLGFAALKNIDDDEKKAEISIVIRKSAQGKGIAGEALEQLIIIGFYGMRLNMLYCYTKIENIRAHRLFEKLGFVRGKAEDVADVIKFERRRENNRDGLQRTP